MLTRRGVLASLLAAPLTVPAAAATNAPATSATADARFVLVILRGGLDGLAAVPAVGDRDYARARGGLALARSDVLDLDSHFGLHPALAAMHSRYQRGELLVLHAVATPYRERSHFDAQNVLETGAGTPNAADDGWLNRALPLLSATSPQAGSAIAIGQAVPLTLQGANAVASWSPAALPDADDDTLARVHALYRADAYLAPRLDAALTADAMAGESSGRRRGAALQPQVEATARFLLHPQGPRIAVLEAGGFDTHANQGAINGALANRLRDLDAALTALATSLGEVWSRTVVVVVSEFGRTVAMNGTRGSDHGTAGIALVLGGSVDGGRVIADWPGLARSALHAGRDLAPTLDVRALYRSVLVDHLKLATADVERHVLPDSAGVGTIRLLRRDV